LRNGVYNYGLAQQKYEIWLRMKKTDQPTNWPTYSFLVSCEKKQAGYACLSVTVFLNLD
jgi:hypothetical protein